MKAKLFAYLFIAINLCINISVYPQKNVEVTEINRKMPTYNYSDPNPIANIGRIYPYYRFDGYASQPEDKEWKFIELENDYIKVFITPEIGGKIWGAIEKSTGKEFIYFNHVVKFRDVAMRGPWTSGGIETNFGAIGHAPTCSTPVDYFIRKNDDGSVSCFIGAIDLPSRTEWRIEINLHPDKSWFTTRATWHNPTQMPQSYYQWMNAAVKVAGNLEYAYPGTNYIGHDGSLHNWPIHSEGMDLSWYEKNNFGGYKSYHVIGELTNFFGGYWHDDDFGFGHYANYSGKPGKKLWIWGLSRQGMIWENLLTDNDGQYTEIQSGRLFNQEASESVYTPFKHVGFTPYATDEWTEYWFPVMTTKGVIQASPQASVNLEIENDNLHIYLSANEVIDDTLVIQNDDKILAVYKLNMAPTEVMHKAISFKGGTEYISVRLGTEYIIAPGGTAGKKLSRPLATVDFDWNSVQGLEMKAKALEQERNYALAHDHYLKCLEKDANYLPALVGTAGLHYRSAEYSIALDLASRALSIDTYHPASNFIYASINEKLGNQTDAIDGYSIASASVEYKSAAFLGLARIYFKRGEFNKSVEYAEKSLSYNANNFSASEILIVSLRKSKNITDFNSNVTTTLMEDPLSHYARFENYLMTKDPQDLVDFKKLIRNELPHETYLELAIKYFNLGLTMEAEMVLSSSPEYPMVSYWLAFLNKDSNPQAAEDYYKKANSLDPLLVFPYRQESIAILAWATKYSDSWQPKYYLALIWWNLGAVDIAQEQFLAVDNNPDFYPFYLAKANLFKDSSEIVIQSIKRAHQLSPDNWRTTLELTNHYLSDNDFTRAIKTIQLNFKNNPSNYYLGLSYAKALMLNKQNEECLDLLQNLNVLPNEGATEGRHLYRISNLNLAVDALISKEDDLMQHHLNLAKAWPENLGVGKPYITDERIEDYIQALALLNSGKKKKARQLFQEITNHQQTATIKAITAEDIIVLAAHIQLNQKQEAEMLIKVWQETISDDKFLQWTVTWLTASNSVPAPETINVNQKIGSREYYLIWVIDFLNNYPAKK